MAAPTITTLAAPAPDIFDLDADVPTALVTLADGDKFLVADVNTMGAPNKYVLASMIKSYVQFLVSGVSTTITAAQVSDSDVFVLSDQSATGNANRRFTIAEAKKVFGTAS